MASWQGYNRRRSPDRGTRVRDASPKRPRVAGRLAHITVLVTILTLLLIPSLASAGAWTGGKPVTTVQNGTVTGDLWIDATIPDWEGQGVSDIIKTFTLPETAVGNVTWARLYVSSYIGNMQNDYQFYNLNRWDGDGSPGYEWEQNETGHAPFVFIGQGFCNDNSALGGGTCDGYKMINGHEDRVTSDYLMWYDVADLIRNQTIFVNVATKGSFDGRTKVVTLIVAYNDPDSTTLTRYWVNEGHDALSYYTEANLNLVDTGKTTFGTSGTGNFSSAVLFINHMASTAGSFGFPSDSHDQCVYNCQGDIKYIKYARSLPTTGTVNIQGPFSGVIAWDVTSLIPMTPDGNAVAEDVTFGYARNLDKEFDGSSGGFFKLPLAILVLKSEMPTVANFTANQTSGMVPLAVQFNDTSTGSPPSSWAWDFTGNGTTDSTEQNASFVYTTAGTYNVSLTVASSAGSNTTVRTGLINVTPLYAPVASFTNTTPRSGIAPLTVQFNDTSTGAPTAWNWSFGDTGTGNTSVLQNPSHTYDTPGTYSVNLSVIGAGGENFTLHENYISVASASGIPTAAFSASPVYGSVPLSVSFSDHSTGSPDSWAWDFNNDGITDSSDQTPSYIYTATGTYSVNLTVTNPQGSDSTVRNGYISVFSGDVAVYLEPAILPLSEDETKDIRIMMDNAPAGLAGYDLIVSVENPDIAEITGINYPAWAQLTKIPLVPNTTVLIGGSDTGHRITSGSTDIPLANITVRGNLTGLTVMSVSDIHPDDDQGEMINPSVSGSTVVVGNYSGPVANFSANITSGQANLTVRFTDESANSPDSWEWDFNNDGIVDSVIQNPECTYTDAGSYTINLTVTNIDGSHSLVRPNYITVTDRITQPVAAFSGTPQSGTVPLIVAFTDQSTGSPTSWAWQFGDGDTSPLQNPSHTYTETGTYTVTLTATNTAGSDYLTESGYISVTSSGSGAPVASFSASATSGTVPLSVVFTDTSTGSPTSWSWDFGNGQTSVVGNKTITYTEAGNFTVTLTATNAYGSSTSTQYITVNTATGVPGVAFSGSPTSGAIPLTVDFTDASSGSPTSWAWDLDGDGSVDDTSQYPSYTYTSAGSYTVTLTATNSVGSDYLTKTSYITATESSTASDLSINSTVPNLGSVSGGTTFALEPNPVTIVIRNGGTETSPSTTVQLQSSDGYSGTATVPAIAAGSTATVTVTDTTERSTAGSSITYTATVDPDDTVLETNENNNIKTYTSTVKYNGYKGKRYWSGGNDIITRKTFDINGGIVYSRGDSVYRSGSFGDGGWLSYTVNWADSEPSIPSGSAVTAAYLYVPYTWDSEHIAPDHAFIDFNGQRVSRSSWNYDKSNFGVYSDYEYGLLKYDVTSLYNMNEANSAVFTRENTKYTDPAEAAIYTKISMYEMFLVVVYEHSDSTRKQIFINDNFDLLGASIEYGTTSAEATAYIPFTGMTIDTSDIESATLITFVPSGDSNEGNLLYNGNVIASNVWDYGGTGTGVDGIPQVAVESIDVTPYIQSSGNVFGIQSTDNGGTPCMAAIQQFLVVDLGSSTATTTTTSTTTTTTTTTETITTYKDGPTVTISSSQGSSGNKDSGTGASSSGNAGAGRASSVQQVDRYQASPAEETDKLAGEAAANAAGSIPNSFQPDWLLGFLCLLGTTGVVAYRQGWIPPVPVGPLPGDKNRTCIWEGTKGSISCQSFIVDEGIIRYRKPGSLNITRPQLFMISLVIAGIVLGGAAWSLWVLPSQPRGSPGPVLSADGQGGMFDLIPTIESIQDSDMTNHVPDYPEGFSARNGILFVYHGTDNHPVSALGLELTKGTNSVVITSSTLPPETNSVNNQLTSYLEEMGNGDGILNSDEWLMVYADNCFDSSQADGEPKGKVLVWQPQDARSALEVPLKDSVAFILKDTSDGTILQQGTVLLVPATS